MTEFSTFSVIVEISQYTKFQLFLFILIKMLFLHMRGSVVFQNEFFLFIQ